MRSGSRVRWRTGDRWTLGVIVVIVLTAPLGVRSRDLWVGDETRDAAIADGMLRNGDFLHPQLAGRPVPEKPFFFYAVVASSYRLSHRVDPISTRLPAVLFSALTLMATAAAARRLFSPRAGLLAAIILATTYLFVVNAHDCIVDVALAATVSLGFTAFVRASARAGTPRWDGAFGAAMAASMLAKGLIGPTLLLIATLPFWALSADRRRLRDSASAAAFLLPVASFLLWIGTVWEAAGIRGVKEFLWIHQFGRFAGISGEEFSHHRAPFYFYAVALPGLLFPWFLTLPAAVAEGWRRGRRDPSAPLFGAVALALLFLSVAGTKRSIYFLPVVPIVAVGIAAYLDRKLSESLEHASAMLRGQAAAIGAASAMVALVPALRDGKISLAETVVTASVATVSMWLFIVCGRSRRRLVAFSLAFAIASLVLLDRFSIPQMNRDRSTDEFFARVRARVGPAGSVYAFRLNEDVLGRACLDLKREPIAEDDRARLLADLRRPQTFVLSEPRKIADVRSAEDLVPLETAVVGRRLVGLYAARTRLADFDLPAAHPDGRGAP